MDIRTISKRADGSYVINRSYHVPDNVEFAIEFSECQAWDIAHPGSITIEQEIPIPAQSVQAEIASLESLQTPRRIREAALTDEGRAWLQNLEDQIAAKRAELAGLA